MSERFTTLIGRAAAQLRDGLLRISERVHNMLNDNKVLHLPDHPRRPARFPRCGRVTCTTLLN